AFADIVDVALVRDSDDQDPAAIHGLSLVVQRVSDLIHHEGRHFAIDFAREVDETRLVIQRPHLPREIMRVERNAVTANAGAGRELHETEWFGRGSLDHFPN